MSKIKIYSDTDPLDFIAERLGNHLQQHKQEVSYAKDPDFPPTWFFIQTRRHGHLKSINEKCINITIQGTRDECKITIGSGKWGENIVNSSNQPTLIPYDGIFATDKRSVAPIITERHIWKYLDKNI